MYPQLCKTSRAQQFDLTLLEFKGIKPER